MTSCFSDKTSKIQIVDPSGPVRQMMIEVIRSTTGFETVSGVATITDILTTLESDTINWVMIPLMADQPANALHLLRICSEQPALKNVRVSLMLDEGDTYVLKSAFELGLFSWHKKPFTKDSLTAELKTLVAVIETNKYNEPLVAAHYLRAHLAASKEHQARADLERSLLDVYPGNAEILLNLADPLFQTGKKDEAQKTLQQVKMLDASLAPRVEEVGKALFGAEAKFEIPSLAGEGGSGINVLGIKSAVIVDSDASVLKSLGDLLKRLGTETVMTFQDGDSAWKWLDTNPEPGLVLMEWRIPKVSGPLLVQRIRGKGYLSVPVIVLSSLIKPEDMPLIREMSVTNVVSKPLNQEQLVPTLIWTMQQDRMPTEHQTLERKISNLLALGKTAEAEPLRIQFLSDPHVPLAKKRQIEAKYAFGAGNYALARDAGIEALKLAGDSMIVLNILGKSFMFLRNHEAALKCFKKAQELSPQNVERLCQIAEVETELGNTETATTTIEHARAIDPDSKTVQEAEVKIAIANGDTDAAQQIMGQLESLSNLIGYMNNKAVASSKCGFAQEAVELYRKTVTSIPPDRPEVAAVVLYNLALGLVRSGDLEEAIKELDKLLALKESKVTKKATSLKARLKTATEKGFEFKFLGEEVKPTAPVATDAAGTPEDAEKLATADDYQRMMATVDARRGEICCYMIYNDQTAKDPRVKALFAKAPRFQKRDAIDRPEGIAAARPSKSA